MPVHPAVESEPLAGGDEDPRVVELLVQEGRGELGLGCQGLGSRASQEMGI